MTHDCTDAIRCGQCAEDETFLDCEVCGDPFEPDTGCLCDGHARCPSCLIWCQECRSNMRDDMAAEGIER